MKWFVRIAGGLLVLLGLAFVVLRTPDTDPAAMRAKYGGAPSQFVKLGNGVTVHLRDEGPRDAPAIVLLHGSNADLHTWDAWTANLAKDHRVVRFDQIGHGLTGANPSGDYTPAAYVDEVGRVADTLGLGRFVLTGNSMGGSIALGYALAHPERLDGLVLVDAGGAPWMGKSTGNLGFTLARNPVGGWLLGRITPRGLVAKSVRQTVTNQAVATDATIDRYWELLRYPGNRAATAARFAMPRTPYDPAALGRLAMPVLILWGEKDPLIPVEAGRWFERAIPASELVVYPGIGHIPMEEAAQASLSDLRGWLAAIPRPPEPAP